MYRLDGSEPVARSGELNCLVSLQALLSLLLIFVPHALSRHARVRHRYGHHVASTAVTPVVAPLAPKLQTDALVVATPSVRTQEISRSAMW